MYSWLRSTPHISKSQGVGMWCAKQTKSTTQSTHFCRTSADLATRSAATSADVTLRVRRTAKMAISSTFLVLRLTERKRHCQGSRATIKVNLHNVGDIFGCKIPLLSPISFN